MDRLPPLNPLKAFEVTGRLLSVTKAAEELCVTPAAVSRQVKVLEEFLGVQLFKRSPGRVELTSWGSRYLSEVSPLLVALRTATNAVTGGIAGRHALKIRSPATFAVRWLIPRLAAFHKANPDIDVQLTTSAVELDFDHEDIDAGIQLGNGRWPRKEAERLVPNVLVPVVAAPDVRGKPTPTDPKQLADETLLHSLARLDDWALWTKASGLSDVNPYRGMKYETSLLAYQAAMEGHGVAIAQAALVEKELAAGQLIKLFNLELDLGELTYYFVFPSGRPESRAMRAFKEWLAATVHP
jgi:LysR family glycine cleavage system transcriptional activator